MVDGPNRIGPSIPHTPFLWEDRGMCIAYEDIPLEERMTIPVSHEPDTSSARHNQDQNNRRQIVRRPNPLNHADTWWQKGILGALVVVDGLSYISPFRWIVPIHPSDDGSELEFGGIGAMGCAPSGGHTACDEPPLVLLFGTDPADVRLGLGETEVEIVARLDACTGENDPAQLARLGAQIDSGNLEGDTSGTLRPDNYGYVRTVFHYAPDEPIPIRPTLRAWDEVVGAHRTVIRQIEIYPQRVVPVPALVHLDGTSYARVGAAEPFQIEIVPADLSVTPEQLRGLNLSTYISGTTYTTGAGLDLVEEPGRLPVWQFEHTFTVASRSGIPVQVQVLDASGGLIASINPPPTVEVIGPVNPPGMEIALPDNDIFAWERPTIVANIRPNPEDAVISSEYHFELVDPNTGTIILESNQSENTWSPELPEDIIPPGTATVRPFWVRISANVDTENLEPTEIEATNNNLTLTVRRPGEPSLSASPSDEYPIYERIEVPIFINGIHDMDALENAALDLWVEKDDAPLEVEWVDGDGTTVANTFTLNTTSQTPIARFRLPTDAIDPGTANTASFRLHVSGSADLVYNDAALLNPIATTILVRRPGQPDARQNIPDPYIDLSQGETPTIEGIILENPDDPITSATFHFTIVDPSTGAIVDSTDITTSATFAAWTPTIPAPAPGSTRAYRTDLSIDIETAYRTSTISTTSDAIRISNPTDAVAQPILNVSVPFSAAVGEEFSYQIIGVEPDTTYVLSGPPGTGIGGTFTFADAVNLGGVMIIDIPITISSPLTQATLLLQATNAAGGESQFVHTMTITPASAFPNPVLNVRFTNPEGSLCFVIPADMDPSNDSCTVTLDATDSYALDADSDPIADGIVNYEIDWGNGITSWNATGILSHEYLEPGFFTTRLTITDVNGNTTSRLITIQTSI